ncbi:hypothetical protein PJK55_14630 [Exiguobacterium sp. MMG028]|uniref:hypothetical protein n=1 Tax=Exiguobacterium sp. MMG028 TaxID=3021979 RepID=UPI0022FF14A9|nr:hypothetical protein [Exiguobacterium sp. MMG028]MDA5561972.1 hypothetical protein [Exiguobacterium sp. MMG028]
MIRKMKNGSTHIKLGNGTCYHGVFNYENDGKTVIGGICFKNKVDENDETDVFIEIANEKGVASYMMALISYMEHATLANGGEITEAMKNLKDELKKSMPEDNTGALCSN